ncbi:Eco57I restriction-modification methylase domain-containing protein [Haloarcula marismortui]|uniref:site-specific DNA-methyltransferase (adenine-specific) n=1 Tax=Haloarcula marismortui ATCC 33799 TaxID=662475 RepID=M0K2B5_9EURY|nr:TaqI-like C-terminal specificity domain-containing protein [Haloarcula californiae]EMA14933.1 putative restriction/modification enzyme [Haloarcula californiae ATCC 33799]
MSQATLGSPYRNSDLFAGYYLDERVADLDDWECDDDAAQAFEDLQALWEGEGDLLPSYNEDELLGAWIDEVLDILGFDTLQETTLPDSGGYNDRLLFESADARRDAARQKRDGNTEGMYGLSAAVLEAKQWDADFTERFSEQRSYRDASHQIKYYLEHTPERVAWGVLTNGKQWRLYGTKDYATETYYEVNLPELLEEGDLEAFKYFYAFFWPEAFRETAGTSFLDTVWNESETAAQELGEDLQDNVFTALRVLGEGFIHTNDLDIDPDDEDARAELKEQSLVLLYRLMFVLYAESRGLIHPDDPDAQDEYEEHFSLDQLRADIHEDIQSGDSFEDYSGHSTRMWNRLENLFGLVDEGEKSLGIPPYNGGLFDEDQHEFLAENEVSDRHIAEVIYRLGTTEGDDGEFVLADYADLDTRHLGSIYEGLLEHEFRIAPEQYAAVAEDGGQVWKPATDVSVADAVETVDQGELYVVNDDGERKATGAYYTPDYVVSYIVEETVDPLLDDIKSELEADGLEPSETEYFRRFWQQVLDLKILDPAMGSAHFLTSATGYLTEQVMEVVREQEIQGYDEQELRREIAKECIYGVDVNGMAVELGKLSMWLETLAADKPLAFLDHHLKTGNSLVGSDITEVLSDDIEENGGQLTLGQAFARARQQTLEHVMDLMQDLLAIDNDELADIKSMEELYGEIREDPLYQRLFEVANVHTAEQFGLDVPNGVYEDMAGAIEDEREWAEIREADWFSTAQAMAADEDFFHWELEFPEVFFGADGSKLDGAGFDAVIGNPPYVNIMRIPDKQVSYLSDTFDSAFRRFDLYVLFSELAGDLIGNDGSYGYIVPDKILTESYASKWRQSILKEDSLTQILDLRDQNVFDDATNSPVVFILNSAAEARSVTVDEHGPSGTESRCELSLSEFRSLPESQIRIDWHQETPAVLQSIRDGTFPLSRLFYASWGTQPGNADRFVFDEYPTDIEEGVTELIKGTDIDRYAIQYAGRYLWYDPDELHRPAFPELFENDKICLRKVAGKRGLIAALDRDSYYTEDSVINLIRKSALAEADDDILSARGIEVVSENRSSTNTENSKTYDRDTTIYDDDLQLSKEVGLEPVLGIINSTLIHYYYSRAVSGQLNVFPEHVRRLPLEHDQDVYQRLLKHVENVQSLTEQRDALNCSLMDHLGSYSDGPTLADVGLTQPPEDSADSILQQTTEQKPNLRVGEASVVRESVSTVEIQLTARYKPDDEDAYETDQWGYTETEPLPALRITDLTETEGDLIEAFVPVAVDEAGGFAGFRETATKTNSLVDRLRKLTLPAVDDVRDGLVSYMETVERADELELKIERTDELIDEIVYELYGLTDEEIEIVEEAVGE